MNLWTWLKSNAILVVELWWEMYSKTTLKNRKLKISNARNVMNRA